MSSSYGARSRCGATSLPPPPLSLQHPHGTHPRSAQTAAPPPLTPAPCRFMKLHAENIKLEPFNSVKMVSAADYAAALKVPGSFNWQRAANTALVHLGLNFLLPLTTLVIKHREQSDSTDPLAAVGGSDTAYALLRDSLSPHHLYAIGAQPPPPCRPTQRTRISHVCFCPADAQRPVAACHRVGCMRCISLAHPAITAHAHARRGGCGSGCAPSFRSPQPLTSAWAANAARLLGCSAERGAECAGAGGMHESYQHACCSHRLASVLTVQAQTEQCAAAVLAP